ncbi:TetR/AcrR family transcriptional regulator [Rhodococcus sp. ARC_M6]|uniref:TetR/AcrR family transcriptional regulator n=1 Tax=Rhodococcus sp. ARC_M6 TaxID=2928852 RepID=UPI001FB27743|nr:TetR/AcrR family transcriptional regulator [Rhodococcus sp. ARC_M6]MCJ0902790.1 TetR/AcrR family transcriptional regulator [Rhodococcus sp. ARC_M6]
MDAGPMDRPNRAQQLDLASLPKGQLARRQHIIDVAGELLVTDEFERIQIRDVAEGSGVALGTVYRYFTSKEHLYAAVLRDWSATDSETLGSPVDLSVSDSDRMRARLHHSVDRFEKYPTFLRLQGVLRQSTDPIVCEIFAEFSEQVLTSYREQLVDLPVEEASDVVAIVTAVLAHELNLFGLGRQSTAEVHRLLDRTVDLIFTR